MDSGHNEGNRRAGIELIVAEKGESHGQGYRDRCGWGRAGGSRPCDGSGLSAILGGEWTRRQEEAVETQERKEMGVRLQSHPEGWNFSVCVRGCCVNLTLDAAYSDAVLSGTGNWAPGHSYPLPRQLSRL